MARTIRNPVEWAAQYVTGSAHYVEETVERLGGAGHGPAAEPELRRIEIADLRGIVEKGVADFAACRSDVMFLVLIYPVVGLLVTWLAFHGDLLPLVFPAASGFALIGPLAGVGLYEMSRRLEKGETVSWAAALGVIRSPSFGAIVVLGLLLIAIFFAWLRVALGIYDATLGPEIPVSVGRFAMDVLTTQTGWAMIILGLAVGFAFACAVLAISVVSFPLLLDRDVGLPEAVLTSVRVTLLNARPMGAWGLIVAVALLIGSIPLFLGLIVVLPVLGHATWHLYRATVVPERRGE